MLRGEAPVRFESEAVLDRFRCARCCEWCGRWVSRAEPHHFYHKRGMGAGSQLDIPENLVSLCTLCHRAAENRCPSPNAPERGPVTREALLEIVARRERWEEEALKCWLNVLGRARARP
jgi:hypothetical protein